MPHAHQHLTAVAVAAQLRPLLPALAARYGLTRMAIFGSVARGTARPNSDVDLLVDLRGGQVSLFDLLKLEAELSAVVGRNVHLTERNALPEPVLRRVQNEAVAL